MYNFKSSTRNSPRRLAAWKHDLSKREGTMWAFESGSLRRRQENIQPVLVGQGDQWDIGSEAHLRLNRLVVVVE